ncbi:DUF2510 domain-containing protein [Leifsonia shinshuensis]|uniref:DUF2510 domain-containing protein n=1 Tax=Leifsonia shinshuensis TaxID=150026 RepID=A0A7G6Y7T9_9MICO|nr:DUF2510 domain-containing protein [Leifsonia shinshuensis]QNE34554.1 DUF2510 domain-containing protein [Leifsonia shinshuensis]
MSQLPPPGWYPDADTRFQRWWDGLRWTDAVRPLAPSLPVAGPPPTNGLATASLAAGVVAAAVVVLALTLGGGVDPLLALLILVGVGLSVGLGIPALIRAGVLPQHLGRARAVWGICLGAGALLGCVLAVALVFGGTGVDGGTNALGAEECPAAAAA